MTNSTKFSDVIKAADIAAAQVVREWVIGLLIEEFKAGNAVRDSLADLDLSAEAFEVWISPDGKSYQGALCYDMGLGRRTSPAAAFKIFKSPSSAGFFAGTVFGYDEDAYIDLAHTADSEQEFVETLCDVIRSAPVNAQRKERCSRRLLREGE